MRLLLSILLCLLNWPALATPPPEPMLATTYRDGVLHITVQRRASSQPRRIAIE